MWLSWLNRCKQSISRRRLLLQLGSLVSLAAARRAPAQQQTGLDARSLGLYCDGRIEDRQLVQRAFDHAAETQRPLMIPGPIRVAGPLHYRSNLTLVGQDKSAAIIAAEPLGDAHLLSTEEAAPHANVVLRNLQLRGAGAGAPAAAALLRFGMTEGVVLSHCTFADHAFALVGLFGCSRVTISDCRFTRWGKPMPSHQGGSALHLAGEPHVRPSQQAEVARNSFENGERVALSIYGQHVNIHDNVIHAVREAGIWASRDRDDPMSKAEDLIIRDNSISSVRQMDISATGIEIDVEHAVVIGNRVTDTDSSGIKILGYCTDVVVRGSTFTDTVRKPGVFHRHAQIMFQYNHETAQPARITIEDNVVRDDASPKVAPFAIGFLAARGMTQIPSLVIRNNDIRGAYAQAPALLPSGFVGPGSQVSL